MLSYLIIFIFIFTPVVSAEDQFNGTAEMAIKDSASVVSAQLSIDPPAVNDEVVIDVLKLKDMELSDVFELLSEKSGINIISGTGVSGRVTIFLSNVKLKDALRIILDSNGLAYALEDGVVRVMPAVDYERRYGHSFGGDIQSRIVKLSHMEVTDIVPILNQVKSTAGKIIPEPKSNTLMLMDSSTQLDLMENLINKVDVAVKTQVFNLSYANAKDIAEKIEGNMTSQSGKVRYDERSNKLIVTDIPSHIDVITKFIDTLDVKEQQVLIESKIIQIVLSDQTKLGVDWDAVVSKVNDLEMTGNFDVLSSSDKGGTLNVGTFANDNYTFLMEALNSIGASNILSSPRITAINGQEAKILVGSSEPYVTSTTTTTASGPSTTAESVNFIDVGVKLYVTPQIHKDHFITMKIKPEVSSAPRTLKTSNNNLIPIVDTSEAETVVTVKDGVTIVIGGLIKEESVITVNKIPILGDIPLLGKAFRNSDDLKRKTEIVVFLTPRIISGDVPAPNVPASVFEKPDQFEEQPWVAVK